MDQRLRQRHAPLVTDGPNSNVGAEKMEGWWWWWGGKHCSTHTHVGAWRVPAPWPAFIFRSRLYRDHRKSFRLISFEGGLTELDIHAKQEKKNSSGTKTTWVRFLQLQLRSQPFGFLYILLEQPSGLRWFGEANGAGARSFWSSAARLPVAEICPSP